MSMKTTAYCDLLSLSGFVEPVLLQLSAGFGVIGVERLYDKLLMAALLLESRLLSLLLPLPIDHHVAVLGFCSLDRRGSHRFAKRARRGVSQGPS